jgi:hypothetical protein
MLLNKCNLRLIAFVQEPWQGWILGSVLSPVNASQKEDH